MLLTFIVWFIFSQLTLGLNIYMASTDPVFDWVYILVVLRSLFAVLMTAVRPLYLSYNKRASLFILPPNQEAIETLDMVL
jgi:hypothetical protein